jgi:hypothetical protein
MWATFPVICTVEVAHVRASVRPDGARRLGPIPSRLLFKRFDRAERLALQALGHPRSRADNLGPPT